MLNHDDVFCDVINATVFKGVQRLKPNETESYLVRQSYLNGQLKEVERDVLKLWRAENGIEILIGIENQTRPHSLMAYRMIGYDGISYMEQLKKYSEEKKIRLLLSIVLYFGDKEWKNVLSLLDNQDIDPILREVINDWKTFVFQIGRMTRQEVDRFQSDFWIIADFLLQKRETSAYIPTKKEMKYPQEVLMLLTEITGDSTYIQTYERMYKTKGEVKDMCIIIENIRKEAEQRYDKEHQLRMEEHQLRTKEHQLRMEEHQLRMEVEQQFEMKMKMCVENLIKTQNCSLEAALYMLGISKEEWEKQFKA